MPRSVSASPRSSLWRRLAPAMTPFVFRFRISLAAPFPLQEVRRLAHPRKAIAFPRRCSDQADVGEACSPIAFFLCVCYNFVLTRERMVEQSKSVTIASIFITCRTTPFVQCRFPLNVLSLRIRVIDSFTGVPWGPPSTPAVISPLISTMLPQPGRSLVPPMPATIPPAMLLPWLSHRHGWWRLRPRLNTIALPARATRTTDRLPGLRCNPVELQLFIFFLFALLFPVPSAGDILAVLFSSNFILISVADA